MYELESFSSEISKVAPWEINDKSAKWKHIRNMLFCFHLFVIAWVFEHGFIKSTSLTSVKYIAHFKSDVLIILSNNDNASYQKCHLLIDFDAKRDGLFTLRILHRTIGFRLLLSGRS